MRLNDSLVTQFEFKGREYSIDLAFDNVLDVFSVMGDTTLREHEMVDISLTLLIGEQEHEEPIELWNYIYTTFIERKQERIVQLDRAGNPMPVETSKSKPVYDLEQDAEYIYGAFRQAYGINLYKEQGKMHWSEFRALLNSLPSNTMLQKIIDIRTWKPSKGDSSEHKKNMRELQRVYALCESEGVDE